MRQPCGPRGVRWSLWKWRTCFVTPGAGLLAAGCPAPGLAPEAGDTAAAASRARAASARPGASPGLGECTAAADLGSGVLGSSGAPEDIVGVAAGGTDCSASGWLPVCTQLSHCRRLRRGTTSTYEYIYLYIYRYSYIFMHIVIHGRIWHGPAYMGVALNARQSYSPHHWYLGSAAVVRFRARCVSQHGVAVVRRQGFLSRASSSHFAGCGDAERVRCTSGHAATGVARDVRLTFTPQLVFCG